MSFYPGQGQAGANFNQQGYGYPAGGAANNYSPNNYAANNYGANNYGAPPQQMQQPQQQSWAAQGQSAPGYGYGAQPAGQQMQFGGNAPQGYGAQQPPAYSRPSQPSRPAAAWGQTAQTAAPRTPPNAWQQSWSRQSGWQPPAPKPAAPTWSAKPAAPAVAWQPRPQGIVPPKPAATGWGGTVPMAKPAARPWAAALQGAVHAAPQAKPAPVSSAVMAAKAAAEALRQQATIRPPMARRLPSAKPAARLPVTPTRGAPSTTLQQAQLALAKQRALAEVQRLQKERAQKAAGTAAPAAKAAANAAGAVAKAIPAVVRPPAPTASWVQQLSKMVMNPWVQRDRPVLDLLRRFPTLEMAQDLVKVTCHYGDEDWRGVVPLYPLAETLNIDEDKDIIRAEAPELEGDAKRIVRVALLTGKSLTTPSHISNRIQFVLHKTEKPATLPGGPWLAKDGKDADTDATLKNTAVRLMKELYNVDLKAINFHRFLDLHYSTEDGPVHTTIMLPELWSPKDIPIGLGRIMKEIEQEVVRHESNEEPMSEEELVAANKSWNDRIERQRNMGKQARPGEREVDRIERLERLEETLKELEKKRPEVKTTKIVTKEIKEMKKLKQPLAKPAFLALNTIRDLSLAKTGPPAPGVFETKLFALCFDELLRLEAGVQIVDWMAQYKERAQAEGELRVSKRKRDLEQTQEWEKLSKERAAKKQKVDAEKRVAELARLKAEKEKQGLREADRLEKEQIEKELKGDAASGADDDETSPPPPLKLTKLVYDLKEEESTPFLYFDTAAQAPCGNMPRTDLLQIFHRSGEACQREVQELVKVTLLDTPAAGKVGVGMFSYRGACSVQREAEPEEATPATKEGEATPMDTKA